VSTPEVPKPGDASGELVFRWIVLVGCGHWFYERVAGDVIPVDGEERFCSVHMRKFPAVYLPAANLVPLGEGWVLR